MSWNQLNNYELQAARRILCLDVKEAADLIGKVSARTWQYWESGRNKVPADVELEIYGLIQQRNLLIDNTFEELPADSDVELRWYHTFDEFAADYPASNKVIWRLHQSVFSYLFCESNNIHLSNDTPLNKDSLFYKWANGQLNNAS